MKKKSSEGAIENNKTPTPTPNPTSTPTTTQTPTSTPTPTPTPKNNYKDKVYFLIRNASLNVETMNKKSKKKIEENFGLTPTISNPSIEKEDLNDDLSYRTVSTEYSSCKSIAPEIYLDSITYDKYLETTIEINKEVDIALDELKKLNNK